MDKLERTAITNNNLGVVIADKLDDVVDNINDINDFNNAIIVRLATIKRYIAYLTQAVAEVPVANVRIDDLASPIWSRVAAGIYRITKVGAFPENCVSVTETISGSKPDMFIDGDGNGYTLEWISADVLELRTYATADLETAVDSILNNRYINIEVYFDNQIPN